MIQKKKKQSRQHPLTIHVASHKCNEDQCAAWQIDTRQQPNVNMHPRYQLVMATAALSPNWHRAVELQELNHAASKCR